MSIRRIVSGVALLLFAYLCVLLFVDGNQPGGVIFLILAAAALVVLLLRPKDKTVPDYSVKEEPVHSTATGSTPMSVIRSFAQEPEQIRDEYAPETEPEGPSEQEKKAMSIQTAILHELTNINKTLDFFKAVVVIMIVLSVLSGLGIITVFSSLTRF